MTTSYIVTSLDLEGQHKATIPDRNMWIRVVRLFDGFSIFTDGLKMDTDTGSADYITERDIRLPFGLFFNYRYWLSLKPPV